MPPGDSMLLSGDEILDVPHDFGSYISNHDRAVQSSKSQLYEASLTLKPGLIRFKSC